MSTFATAPGHFHGESYSDASTRIVRISTCLLNDVIGLDIETPDDDYDRTVIDPAAARELAAKLLWAADLCEHRGNHTGDRP